MFRKRHPRRKAFAAILTTLGVVATSLVVAPTANAASNVVVGLCTIKSNNPHGSEHVKGTINATGTISCSMKMTEMYIHVKIERSDGLIVSGGTDDRFNADYLMENAATPCSNSGTWRSRVEYAIEAPAGVSPAYTANNITSPWYPVACGVAKRAPIELEQVVEITVPASSLKK